jgi:hypothetical protein
MITTDKPTVRRAMVALAIGALVGAVLVLATSLVPAFLYPASAGGLGGAPWERIRNSILLISIFAFPIFLVGLLVVGAPAWVLAHRFGYRRWYHAMALGGVLTFLTTFSLNTVPYLLPVDPGSGYSAGDSGGDTIVNGRLTAHGWSEGGRRSLALALAGAIVGLTVWYTAYWRRNAVK